MIFHDRRMFVAKDMDFVINKAFMPNAAISSSPSKISFGIEI
jgi:hypothetical protein